jgi:carbon storage regulator CsrA
MLVLSRKESDKILFPTVGIKIEVLRLQGNTVRIGIDAPSDVPIYRHELADLKAIDFSSEQDTRQQLRDLAMAVRQRLDAASISLNELHAHLEDQGDAQGQDLILRLFRELRALDDQAGESLDSNQRSVARALLVEDDPNERQLMASYLQLRGIETTTANDGQDALDFLQLHAVPDVVLLDMHMPRCDGHRLVRKIRSDSRLRDVKLIAVSGTDPYSLGVPCGSAGIDRWFAKPVDPEQVVAGITEELGVAAVAV